MLVIQELDTEQINKTVLASLPQTPDAPRSPLNKQLCSNTSN